jgi:hypothetical protein
MGKKLEGFEWNQRVSGDYESVDRFLHEGLVTPEVASAGELLLAAEWLSTYDADSIEDAQRWANVIGFLVAGAEAKEKRTALAKAKREYAKAHGIKVSQVRVKKETK